jgi:hypothetical protein
MKILSGLILLLIPLCLMAQVPMQPPQAEAITDSVSQSREQEILTDYGFRDLDTLTSVAKKLQIRDVNRWKAALGLEPANRPWMARACDVWRSAHTVPFWPSRQWSMAITN